MGQSFYQICLESSSYQRNQRKEKKAQEMVQFLMDYVMVNCLKRGRHGYDKLERYNYWTIQCLFSEKTKFDSRIYSLSIVCGNNYPAQAPKVKFNTKINLGCVTSSGEVDVSKFSVLKNWNKSYSLETVLVGIYNEMKSNANKNLNQPGEGESYQQVKQT